MLTPKHCTEHGSEMQATQRLFFLERQAHPHNTQVEAILKGETNPTSATLRYRVFAIGAYFEVQGQNKVWLVSIRITTPSTR